jgi:hypothetical protein
VHFWRVRPISDEISADHFVLVVNAREYKTHEMTAYRRHRNTLDREEESSFAPLPAAAAAAIAVVIDAKVIKVIRYCIQSSENGVNVEKSWRRP